MKPTYKTSTDYTNVWTFVTRISKIGPEFDDQFASRRDAIQTIAVYVASDTFVVDGIEYHTATENPRTRAPK